MSIRTQTPIGRIPLFDEGQQRRAQRSRGALLIASFGAFLAFLDATIVNVCFPAIEHTFHGSSTSALAWVLNAYNLVFAAMLVAGGRLADVLGRRRMFMGGVALFTASSALCATAQSLDTLIFWRVWQAVGAALLVPASLGVVIHASTEERRSHAVSLWGATAALAAGLGPPVGGAIVAVSSWRMAFLVNLPLGLAAWWFGSRMIDESRSPGRRRMPDLVGVAILAAALASLSLGIVRGPDWSWLSWQSIACFAVAVLLLAWVGVRTTSHPVPVIDPGLLRIRTFAVANVATALAGMGMYAYLLNHILWLTNVWRFSLLQAGLAVAPSALVTAVVASKLGSLAQARGFRAVAVPGAVVWAIGLWWFVHRVGTTPHYLTQWLPGAILAGVGAGATLPILGSAALSAVPGGRYATASSVVSAVRQLGGVLGVSILVVIVGEASPARPLEAIRMLRDGWQLSMWCFVAVAVCAVGIAARSDAVEEHNADQVVPTVERNDLALANERGVSQLEAFRDIAPDVVDRLAAIGVRREVFAGEVLFRTGDPGDSIYVVTAGRLEIIKADAVIGHAGAGAIVGELSVLAGLPRSADVRAVRDSVVVEVPGSEVTAALSASPAAALGLAGMLAAQVARMPAPARPSGLPSTVAVIGLGRPAHAVAERLARLLGPTKRVAIIAEEISPDALIAAEAAHDRVLLVGGTDPGQIEFCRRHADLMVLVVDGDPRTPLPAPGCEVLLEGVTSPARVRAWLTATGARRVHQMALGGLESLAARIGGTSLGLALAGGGARAFAHIGVLRELEAAGIAVHRVAGTSVGSYVGALYAAGQSSVEIEALIREEFVYRNPVSDYGLPRYALSRGHRIANAAERVYGDIVAEALPRELTVMATDIYSREAVAMRHGPLRDITRASAAVPGLLPPVPFEGRMLVDGAVTGNLPAMPLIREGCGPVVALDLAVGGGSGPRANAEPRMPRLGETMMRTLLFAAADEDHRAAAASDYVVRMPTRDIGLLEFHQIDASLEAGRAAGRALVERLSNPVPAPRREEISAET